MQLQRFIDGAPSVANFVIFQESSFFNAIWITFCSFLKPLEITIFLIFEAS